MYQIDKTVIIDPKSGMKFQGGLVCAATVHMFIFIEFAPVFLHLYYHGWIVLSCLLDKFLCIQNIFLGCFCRGDLNDKCHGIVARKLFECHD